MEAHMIIEAIKNEKFYPTQRLPLDHTSEGYAKLSMVPLGGLLKQVRENFSISSPTTKNQYKFLGEEYNSTSSQKCFDSKWKGYFFLQIHMICKQINATFCLNYMENPNQVCNAPDRSGSNLHQFETKHMEDAFKQLEKLGGILQRSKHVIRNYKSSL